MKNTEKVRCFLEFAQELKNAGFQVFTHANSNYGHFVKGDKIGYVEASDYGWNMSTVHKPCKKYGTGFQIYHDSTTATAKMASDCLIVAPRWANINKYNTCSFCGSVLHKSCQVLKYKSWDDYISSPNNQWGEYQEI